jgi:hypothetical protein
MWPTIWTSSREGFAHFRIGRVIQIEDECPTKSKVIGKEKTVALEDVLAVMRAVASFTRGNDANDLAGGWRIVTQIELDKECAGASCVS